MTMLQEYQESVQPNYNLPTINIEGIVTVHKKFQPCILWKIGIVNEVRKGSGKSLNVEQKAFNKQCKQRLAPQEAADINELKSKIAEDNLRAFFAGRV